jgi:hypothetical protein
MGLAMLPPDGFTCLQTDNRDAFATATTVPLHLGVDGTAPSVSVSHALPRRDWVQAEIIDETGRPLSGFSREACEPVCRDGPTQRLCWHQADLTSLAADKPVRLRLYLFGKVRLHAVSPGKDSEPKGGTR